MSVLGKRRWLHVILAGLLVCAAPAAAATDARLSRAKLFAQQNAKALAKGDFKKISEMTHPAVAEKLGGYEQLARNLAFGSGQMAEQGVAIRRVSVKTPDEIITTADGLVTIIPMMLELAVPGGRLKKKSYLVAVSTDEGRTWTFIDGANLTLEALKKVLPSVPDTIKLPAREKAVFEKLEEAPPEPDADPAEGR